MFKDHVLLGWKKCLLEHHICDPTGADLPVRSSIHLYGRRRKPAITVES